jgi:hypothetical protein
VTAVSGPSCVFLAMVYPDSDGIVNEWMGGWVDGWMGGWVDRWMGG